MLSVNKLLKGALVCLTLSSMGGCTFVPLYDDAIDDDMSSIFISTIGDREGQLLRNKLRYLLEGHGSSKKPIYTLNVKLTITDTDLGVSRAGIATRKNKIVAAKIDLIERNTQNAVYSTTLTVENPYVIQTRQFYANPVTEAHITEQSLELLAQLIQTDLAIYFRKNEN